MYVSIKKFTLTILIFYSGGFILQSRTSALLSAQNQITIGAGFGLQSYPSELDPGELVIHYPVLYPMLELSTPFVSNVTIVSTLSRTVSEGSLLASSASTQCMELYTTAVGIDYNFGSTRREFRTGIQFLAGFSTYRSTRFADHYTRTGLGVKLYALGTYPLSRYFSWGIRSGLQRLNIQGLPRGDNLNLDSFNVEMLIYFLL
ncbi:MAG: hypothetical protein JSV97_10345 [candidate division WOR-3 bacterium]|nr:MAG: hypothetical protein JSV97_10345 [candidate division WOR-3 bacterium]